jgi:hypothetical protein
MADLESGPTPPSLLLALPFTFDIFTVAVVGLGTDTRSSTHIYSDASSYYILPMSRSLPAQITSSSPLDILAISTRGVDLHYRHLLTNKLEILNRCSNWYSLLRK